MFSVTRLTANALPLNEWVSSHCRAFALPCLPACGAFTIRTCSLLTCRWTSAQLMPSQATPEDARAGVAAPICSSSTKNGSAGSLVTRDHEEVCPLSRGMMLQSLSARLQGGLRFLLDPVPAPPWADFAACCPRRERYEVSTFRLNKRVGLGACFRPEDVWVTTAQKLSLSQPSLPFGLSVEATSACSG